MKKHTCVFAALAAFCFAFTNTARAEGFFGGYFGPSTVELTGTGSLTGSVDGSGNEFGVFVQRRWDTLGLHVGLGSNSTAVDGVIVIGNTATSFKEEAGLAVDLLGMLILEGEKINGVGMLGYSSLRTEASGGITGSATTSGLKIAVGFEVPFSNDDWIFQLMYEDAALGEVELTGTTAKYEVDQSGFRFRFGARF